MFRHFTFRKQTSPQTAKISKVLAYLLQVLMKPAERSSDTRTFSSYLKKKIDPNTFGQERQMLNILQRTILK